MHRSEILLAGYLVGDDEAHSADHGVNKDISSGEGLVGMGGSCLPGTNIDSRKSTAKHNERRWSFLPTVV